MYNRIFTVIFLILIMSFCPGYSNADEAPEMAWGVQFGTESSDFPKEVAADSHGNIYVVGETNGGLVGENAGGRDGFIVKYNEAGAQEWILQYGTSSTDLISGVDVYPNDDVVVAGGTNGTLGEEKFGGTDVFVSRVNGSGNTIWMTQFGTSGTDNANRLILDLHENCYITGRTSKDLGGENIGGYDAFVIKIDGEGHIVWMTQFGTDSADEGRDIGMDIEGNLYVGGTTSGSFDISNLGNKDAFVTKINPEGEVVWTRQYGTSSEDNGLGIAVSPQGNVYAGGWTYGVIGNHIYGGGDPYLTLFDSDGNRSWTKQFGTSNWDGIHGMAAFHDESGDVLVGGCWNYPSCHGWLRRYDCEGNLKWEKLVYGTASKSSCGQTVYIDRVGNCYHIGGTDDDLFQESHGVTDAFLVKLGDVSDVHGRQSTPRQPDGFKLFQNAPNPFNPTTQIHYSLYKDSQIHLVLTNVQGEVIRTLMNQWESAGTHSIQWDAKDDSGQSVSSGIYFYGLISNNRVEMKKMLLIR